MASKQNVHFLRTVFQHTRSKFTEVVFCSKKSKFAWCLTVAEVSSDQKLVRNAESHIFKLDFTHIWLRLYTAINQESWWAAICCLRVKCSACLCLVLTGETRLHVSGGGEVGGHLLHLLPEGGGWRLGQGLEALWGNHHRTSHNSQASLSFLGGGVDFTHTRCFTCHSSFFSGCQLIRGCRDETNIDQLQTDQSTIKLLLVEFHVND